MNQSADMSQRDQIYRRLTARNRFIGLLRWAVPAVGALALVLLLGQIYLSSLVGRFGIGQVTVRGDSVSIDTPEYAGTLEDGSLYRVSAQSARAGLQSSDIIELQQAALSVERVTGVTVSADAPEANLDTTNRLVLIDGVAHISDTDGTRGVLNQSVFDWAAQTLTSKGAVDIDYANGTKVLGSGMVYDAGTRVWTFTDVTVTLPSTPGADAPVAPQADMP